jgi:hypothetical protein
VTNSGPDAAYSPIIADPLPQGATYSSTFIQQQPTTGWTYAYASGTLTMTGPSLASGAFLIYFVTYTAPNSINVINHTVNIVHPFYQDPNTGNNTLTLTYARVLEGSQPTAGTVLYHFNDGNYPQSENYVAVVDWGDGTTDTTIGPESLFQGQGNAQDTIGNNITTTTNGGVTFRPGKVGQAFQFDGQVGSYFENQYIYNSRAALNSATATWSFWIKTTAVPTGNGMGLMGMMDPSEQNGLALSMNPSGQLVANFARNGTMASLTGFGAINDGGWHQIAVSFQGDVANPVQANIYIDRVLTQSGTVAITGLTSLPATFMRLGSLIGTHWAPYQGSLDEVAVYEKVLTPEQVARLSQGNNVMVVADYVVGYDVIGTHTYQRTGNYDATATVNYPTSVDAYGNPSTSSLYSSVTGLVHLYNGNGNTTDMGGGPPAVITGTAVSAGHQTLGLPAFVFTGANNTSSLTLAPLAFNQSDFSLDFRIKTTSADQETLFSNSPAGGDGLSGNTFSLRMGKTTPGILTLSLSDDQLGPVALSLTTALNDGAFHQVALVRKGTHLSLYIDGQFNASTIGPGVANLGSPQYLIAGWEPLDGTGGLHVFTGQLGQILILGLAQTAGDVYNQTFTISANGAVEPLATGGEIVIQATDALTAGALTPPQGAVTGTPVTGALLFHFSDNTNTRAADYIATVTWGDGHSDFSYNPNPVVTVVANPLGGFDVFGTHTYNAPVSGGTFIASVQDVDGSVVVSVAPVNVAAGALAVMDTGAINVGGTPVAQNIAVFTDPTQSSHNAAADYSATITWGDGFVTSGTILVTNDARQFIVQGTHSYASRGTYTRTVTAHNTAESAVGTSSLLVSVPLTIGALTPPAATEGILFTNANLVHFADTGTSSPAAITAFSATIFWGDGGSDTVTSTATAAGQIVAHAGGGFDVSSAAIPIRWRPSRCSP